MDLEAIIRDYIETSLQMCPPDYDWKKLMRDNVFLEEGVDPDTMTVIDSYGDPRDDISEERRKKQIETAKQKWEEIDEAVQWNCSCYRENVVDDGINLVEEEREIGYMNLSDFVEQVRDNIVLPIIFRV